MAKLKRIRTIKRCPTSLGTLVHGASSRLPVPEADRLIADGLAEEWNPSAQPPEAKPPAPAPAAGETKADEPAPPTPTPTAGEHCEQPDVPESDDSEGAPPEPDKGEDTSPAKPKAKRKTKGGDKPEGDNPKE